MLMGAFLFAYLYLRANNNAGMWRPDGIADLSSLPMAHHPAAPARLPRRRARRRSPRRGAGRAHVGLGAIALVLALAAGGMRVWYQYNLGDHPPTRRAG